MLTFALKKTRKLHVSLPVLLVVLQTGFAAWYLRDFFIPDVNLYLGLCLAPFLLLIRKGSFSFRYLVPALLFLGLAWLIPVKTLVFAALLFGLLFLLESTQGKVSFYLLFLLLLLSPAFRYFSNFFGFPIRLWLSQVAGEMVGFTGQKVEVLGNIIVLNGQEFAVDPACTGLNMLTVSLLLSLFILAFYQRKTGSGNSFVLVAGVLLLTFGLNIAANLFRIVLLVLFKIPAGNLFHDLVGMACLVLYVVLPLLWLLPKLQFTKKLPELATEIPEGKRSFFAPETGLGLGFLLFSATVLVSFKTTETKASLAQQENRLALSGFRKGMMQENITRFENEKALIYVKPVHFYSAEHNPTVCWTGSGYEFTRIRKQTWQGKEIYTGVLQKDSDKLYTAWWFDKGQTKTISHAQWRWKAFRESTQFNLINVTAATEAELQENTKTLLQSRLFE